MTIRSIIISGSSINTVERGFICPGCTHHVRPSLARQTPLTSGDLWMSPCSVINGRRRSRRQMGGIGAESVMSYAAGTCSCLEAKTMSKNRKRRSSREQSPAKNPQADDDGPTYEERVTQWKAENPDFMSLDELEVPDLSDLEMDEDPAERHLLDTVLNPAEDYYQRVREERGPEVIDGLLSTAPNKLGPPSMVRAFNRSTTATCCHSGTGPGGKGTLATKDCKRVCYARRLEQIDMNRRRYELNDKLVSDPSLDFVKLMIGMLQASGVSSRMVRYLRIHSGGEFDSPDYVREWVRIAEACYWVSFWTYTRSWVRDDMMPVLRKLDALPNVRVVLSYDRTMPLPPGGFSVSYLSIDDTDLPSADDKPLVVFRVNDDHPMPQAMKKATLFVCPHQLGTGDETVRDCAPWPPIGCGVCLPPPKKAVPPTV